jgi:hypothetical protein
MPAVGVILDQRRRIVQRHYDPQAAQSHRPAASTPAAPNKPDVPYAARRECLYPGLLDQGLGGIGSLHDKISDRRQVHSHQHLLNN